MAYRLVIYNCDPIVLETSSSLPILRYEQLITSICQLLGLYRSPGLQSDGLYQRVPLFSRNRRRTSRELLCDA